jgi:hypothetical protein
MQFSCGWGLAKVSMRQLLYTQRHRSESHRLCMRPYDTSMNGPMLIIRWHCIKAVFPKPVGVCKIFYWISRNNMLWTCWCIDIILWQVSESSSIQICCFLKCTSNVVNEVFFVFVSKTSNCVCMSLCSKQKDFATASVTILLYMLHCKGQHILGIFVGHQHFFLVSRNTYKKFIFNVKYKNYFMLHI